MPAKTRHKTKYPGVYYIWGKSLSLGRPEKIFYIRYRRGNKLIEEKAGSQSKNDMTDARANTIRGLRIDGKELPNNEQRIADKGKKQAYDNRWTISKLWTEYKANKPNLKGIITDENRYKNYLRIPFGNKEPKELIALDIDRLRIMLLKQRSPGTVKNVLELLRRIINYGVKKNLCAGISFTIEMPKVNNNRTEDLTPEQLDRLLHAIENDSNKNAANMMKLVLFTGMRRGELFKLKWSDIDIQRGFIQIRDPKGGSDQKIPLNDGARLVLESHQQTDSDYVFSGRGGNQRTDIKHQVNRIRDEAGLPKDFRALHGLRHVYASMLASSGKVDMYTLQKLLTHKSPAMTQRYAHLRDDALKNASNIASDLIQQQSTNRKLSKLSSSNK